MDAVIKSYYLFMNDNMVKVKYYNQFSKFSMPGFFKSGILPKHC